MEHFGERAGKAAKSSKSNAELPTKSGQLSPGVRVLSEKGIQKRVAQMIFNGASEADVHTFRDAAMRKLKRSRGE